MGQVRRHADVPGAENGTNQAEGREVTSTDIQEPIMRKLTLLLGGLLLIAPVVLALDDTDPEPPKPNSVVAKLVAKKTTFKLDLGGRTAKQYADDVKAGKVPALAVEMELVITNQTRSDIRVRTHGAVPKLTLTLKGPGVVAAPPERRSPPRVTYVVVKPGQKVSISIPTLSSYPDGGLSQNVHHFWTEPGEYTLSASFNTSIDRETGKLAKAKRPYPTLTAAAIKIKVEK
jgi:hypothetical protein